MERGTLPIEIIITKTFYQFVRQSVRVGHGAEIGTLWGIWHTFIIPENDWQQLMGNEANDKQQIKN